MTRILPFILFLIISVLACLFYNQSVQEQKQQARYEELKSDYHHILQRLNALEHPELVIEEFKDKGRGG